MCVGYWTALDVYSVGVKKTLSGLRYISYLDRLVTLQLKSVEIRRIYFDLLFLYEIIHNHTDLQCRDLLEFSSSSTRCHSFKINVQYSRVNCRKYFFIDRITPIWNSLPNNVVESTSIWQFRSLLESLDLNVYCRGHAHIA